MWLIPYLMYRSRKTESGGEGGRDPLGTHTIGGRPGVCPTPGLTHLGAGPGYHSRPDPGIHTPAPRPTGTAHPPRRRVHLSHWAQFSSLSSKRAGSSRFPHASKWNDHQSSRSLSVVPVVPQIRMHAYASSSTVLLNNAMHYIGVSVYHAYLHRRPVKATR